MSVLVLLSIPVNPENVGDMESFMREELHHTRGADGCNSITVHRNQDDASNMVIVEDWDSRQQYETYLGWRTERGDMEKLMGWCSGEPSITYYDGLGV